MILLRSLYAIAFIAFATCDSLKEWKEEIKLKCFESYLHSENMFLANVVEFSNCDEFIKIEIAAEYIAIAEKLGQDQGNSVSDCVAENAKKLGLHLASMKIYVYQHTKKVEILDRIVALNAAEFEKGQV